MNNPPILQNTMRQSNYKPAKLAVNNKRKINNKHDQAICN
jgi:hypothetical protein